MASAKPPSSSTECRGWCDSTNTPARSDQVQIKHNLYTAVCRLAVKDCVFHAFLMLSRPHRTVPAARLVQVCPDCPTYVDVDSESVRNLVSASLLKFNRESSFNKYFTLGKVTRATSGVSAAHAHSSTPSRHHSANVQICGTPQISILQNSKLQLNERTSSLLLCMKIYKNG